MIGSVEISSQLPRVKSVLAVCAHPDDESFGLGGALSAFSDSGSATSMVCFTRGEASTLGQDASSLGRVRSAELRNAAVELGVGYVELFDYPDGDLTCWPCMSSRSLTVSKLTCYLSSTRAALPATQIISVPGRLL